MKNRFYDPKMHGADWNAAKTAYEPLLDYLVDDDELNTVMMMMIGQLNASHTGVTGGGPANDSRPPLQTRHPGFDLVADASGFYKIAHIYKDGPADRDYLKIKKGDYLIAVDDHDLKTTENYWQYFTLAAGSKFHFMRERQAGERGRLDGDDHSGRRRRFHRSAVREVGHGPPRDGHEVEQRRDRLPAHPRDGRASLRQFQLDLAAKRTKKALVIDQRFNGGGGIDQELLGILAGRQYQYTIGRDAGFQQPRPQNFYGPMVVMQNERSASDAEMFPAGFKALGLGKVVGVPTMGAVIGTGSYTLLNGAAISTPGSGVWTVTGQNMENYRRAARRAHRQHARRLRQRPRRADREGGRGPESRDGEGRRRRRSSRHRRLHGVRCRAHYMFGARPLCPDQARVVAGRHQRLECRPHIVRDLLRNLKSRLGIDLHALQIPDHDADDVVG